MVASVYTAAVSMKVLNMLQRARSPLSNAEQVHCDDEKPYLSTSILIMSMSCTKAILTLSSITRRTICLPSLVLPPTSHYPEYRHLQ